MIYFCRSDLSVKEDFPLAVSDVEGTADARTAQGIHQKRRRLGLLNNLYWVMLYEL